MNSNLPTLRMKKRLKYGITTMILAGFLALVVSLVNIGVLNHDMYTQKANAQQLRPETIPANRGTIYDRNMQILAQSATAWDVSLSPKDFGTDSEEETAKRAQMAADGLAKILDLDAADILEKYTKNKERQYVLIKSKVEKETQEELLAFIKENKLSGAVNLTENTKRYYPNGTLACSVVGFTGTDNYGLAGIEAKYDDLLGGTPGYSVSLKDGHSTSMAGGNDQRYDPIDGNSLVLTIDEHIQSFAEKAIDQIVLQHNPKKGACIIVSNVNTGEIYAMANSSKYDLNDPFTVYDAQTAAALAELSGDEYTEALSSARQAQWSNKAISMAYQPGSTYKTIVASAALEEKTESLNSSFNCPGYITVEDRTMKCHHTAGHGVLNFSDALVNSCNPAFVKIGQKLGGDLFFKYFKAFGFASKTGIDISGEGTSHYYTAEQLNRSLVSLSSCSFGQSLAVTPIQLISAVSAVVNGGKLITPHVVKQILDSDGNVVETVEPEIKRQVISQETSETMRKLMENVVTAKGGTNAVVKGYRVGGKSGTSQKQNPGDDEEARIGSYIAVAPIDDPEVAVLVVIDEPQSGQVYGSVIAAPPAAALLADILPYLGFTPNYSAEELAKMNVTTPYLTEMGVLEAESKLASLGLTKPRVIGSGSDVIRQMPTAGSPMPKDGRVILYTDSTPDEMAEVPNVVGLTPGVARQKLEQRGLNVIIEGSEDGVDCLITLQSIAEGSKVPIGTVIEITSVISGTD